MTNAAEPWRAVAVLAILVLGFGCSTVSSAQGITRTKAIAIALGEAHRLNVVLENYPVKLLADDEHSAPHRWRKRLETNPELAHRVQSKPYWAVFIEPTSPGLAVLGGPRVIVFIDVTNGAVLGHLKMAGDVD